MKLTAKRMKGEKVKIGFDVWLPRKAVGSLSVQPINESLHKAEATAGCFSARGQLCQEPGNACVCMRRAYLERLIM